MAPYTIDVDEKRHILRAMLRGFWDVATARSYVADLATNGARVARGGTPSWWLIDMKTSQVQSREVSELLRDRLPAVFPPAMTLAVIVDASLPAVQARRVVPNDHHRHFNTLATAERWLTESGMPA